METGCGYPPPIPVTVAATGPRGLALAGEFADTWGTSFRTAAEVVTQREDFAVLGAFASSLTVSLEIDAFIGTTRSAADQVLRRATSERPGEDLDAVFERALLGTPDVVAEQLAVLGRAGVDQVVVALHDPHDPDALEALAQSAERLS